MFPSPNFSASDTIFPPIWSGSDSRKYADLGRIARRFLQSDTGSPNESNQDDPQLQAEVNKLASILLNFASPDSIQPLAYIEEVLENIQKGDPGECAVCLESPEDPVFTPCAHKFCRECLFSCWGTPAGGQCPMCRNLLQKDDLITCPSESPFKVDIKNNVTESSKFSKLFEFLEGILNSPAGEKSIVFSQWTSFFDLLENPLRRRGIGFLRYDGKLTQKQREKVLDEFNKTREKRVSEINLNFLFSISIENSATESLHVTGFADVAKGWWCWLELNCSLKCFHYGMLCLFPFSPLSTRRTTSSLCGNIVL